MNEDNATEFESTLPTLAVMDELEFLFNPTAKVIQDLAHDHSCHEIQ